MTLPGGESSAQTDRIFVVLHCAWHADRAVHRKSCISRDTGRRASSDRLSIVLLFIKKEAESLSFFFLNSTFESFTFSEKRTMHAQLFLTSDI